MDPGNMKIRAVIFDIYGTVLQVGPPPAQADSLWRALFEDIFQKPPWLTRLEFSVACNRAITLRHNAAHARGIAKPEILWPSVLAEVLTGFAKLKVAAQNDFVYRQMQIGRSLILVPGIAPALRWLVDKRCPLGIASNAQAYTLRELETLFKPEGLDLNIFQRDLRVWSFENGFSKPDPHVFQMMRARLEARNIPPQEALVVGDRLDNDVTPARQQGFQTWHLHNSSPEGHSGNAEKLRDFLARLI
jgi:FMN phosphatase YigB (HAD superfamily)